MQSNFLNLKQKQFLKNISLELNTQDSRCTSYPVWRILKIKKYIGFKEQYSDGVCIYNKNTGEIYEDKASLVECILENGKDIEGSKYIDINKFLEDRGYKTDVSVRSLIDIIDTELNVEYLEKEYYKEIHELEGCFLTKSGIDEYIESNKHKITDDMYVYVDSAWDNKELTQLIDILKTGM